MTHILPNGDLCITAPNPMRRALREAYILGGYPEAESVVLEWIREDRMMLELVPPENIGALTSAPIVAECDWPDDGSGPVPFPDAPVWWYPNYAVTDPWEELKNKGRVIFTRAQESA